jgi:hypothetical protein
MLFSPISVYLVSYEPFETCRALIAVDWSIFTNILLLVLKIRYHFCIYFLQQLFAVKCVLHFTQHARTHNYATCAWIHNHAKRAHTHTHTHTHTTTPHVYSHTPNVLTHTHTQPRHTCIPTHQTCSHTHKITPHRTLWYILYLINRNLTKKRKYFNGCHTF